MTETVQRFGYVDLLLTILGGLLGFFGGDATGAIAGAAFGFFVAGQFHRIAVLEARVEDLEARLEESS